jgi:hypothetical protein
MSVKPKNRAINAERSMPSDQSSSLKAAKNIYVFCPAGHLRTELLNIIRIAKHFVIVVRFWFVPA